MTLLRILLPVLFITLISACDSGGQTDVKVTDNSTDAPFTIVSTTTLLRKPDQSTCPSGGAEIHTGFDKNGNAVLDADEIAETVTVCNGDSYLQRLVEISDEPAGDNCAKGGDRISQGVDANANGILDASEVDKNDYICSQSPVIIQTSLEIPGDNCPFGGHKLETGVDLNDDTKLTGEEVFHTSYLCPNQNRLVNSQYCTANLAAKNGISGMSFEYIIDEFLNGEIVVKAEIRNPRIGVNKEYRWSPWLAGQDDNWLAAISRVNYDTFGDATSGYWLFKIQRVIDPATQKAQPWIVDDNRANTPLIISYHDIDPALDTENKEFKVSWQTNLADCGGEDNTVQ